MKSTLHHLFAHKTLTETQAYEVLMNISKGNCPPSEIVAIMTVFLMRPITVEELSGFRKALLDLCLPVDLHEFDTLDIVGTGGDGKNTFNISTATCFVVAAAGVKVSKHGNYAVSSTSGSSNVIEYLGYRFKNEEASLKEEVDKAGICFLHAPFFHPALKQVASVRKELGVRTFFNIMGPLVNPAYPKYQMLGVYNLEIARMYNYLLQNTGNNFTIVHSLDGYDEISLTSDACVIDNQGQHHFSPEALGKRHVFSTDLYGGNSIPEAAKILTTILKGEGTWPQSAVVLANAALALKCTGTYASYEDAYQAAVESLESGKAYQTLENLIALQ